MRPTPAVIAIATSILSLGVLPTSLHAQEADTSTCEEPFERLAGSDGERAIPPEVRRFVELAPEVVCAREDELEDFLGGELLTDRQLYVCSDAWPSLEEGQQAAAKLYAISHQVVTFMQKLPRGYEAKADVIRSNAEHMRQSGLFATEANFKECMFFAQISIQRLQEFEAGLK